MEPEHLSIHNGSVRLEAIAAGPVSGPLLILLHGFPEFNYSWRKQIGSLAEAGFRVVAPDGRGYNNSSKPSDIASYSLPFLSADVIAIADQLGRNQFLLAGHDWGAAVAWHTAAAYPTRVSRLIILNAPHPGLLIHSILKRPAQLLRSWYMFFFQLPRIPEFLFSIRNFEGVAKGLTDASRPGTFSPTDLERYREAWVKPGALTGMINWYRALFRHRPRMGDSRITAPTLILWGTRDRFVLPELAKESLAYCDKGELVYFPEATHWLHLEEPEKVNAAMIRFLAS